MIRKIPPVISPELLKILAEMGHGETILLADANFPVMSSKAKHIIRADGIGISILLKAVLELIPVDHFIKQGVTLMEVEEGDSYVPSIWNQYKKILENAGITEDRTAYVQRTDYYKQADEAYCIVATGERSRYANVLLKKGIFEAPD